MRPQGALTKTSSRQFARPKLHGHGREVSRFTVVSNATKAETVKSYDPFKASHPQNLSSTNGPVFANVVVHRGRPTLQDIKASPRASQDRSNMSSGMLAPRKPFASRSSLASSTRSRSSARGIRVPPANKRGVSFSQLRKVSGKSQKNSTVVNQSQMLANRHSRFSEVTDDGGDSLRAVGSPNDSAGYVRSRKARGSASQDLARSKESRPGSKIWQEDVRQLSSSLAHDCDEAFNKASMISTVGTKLSSCGDGNDAVYETSISSILQDQSHFEQSSSAQISRHATPLQGQECTSWHARPLPLPPTRSESVNMELAEARKQAELRRWSANGDESSRYLDRIVSHIDRLMLPNSSPHRQRGGRRTASAPVNSRVGLESNRPLPAIVESPLKEISTRNSEFEDFMDRERTKHGAGSRVTSAPEPRITRLKYAEGRTARRGHYQRESIRVVQSSSLGPTMTPAPLNIRKKACPDTPTMTGALPAEPVQARLFHPLDLQEHHASSIWRNGLPHMTQTDEADDPFNENPTSYGTAGHKKSSWFKRNAKNRAGKSPVPMNAEMDQINAKWPNRGEPIQKKSFGFGRLFGKLKQDGTMSVPRKSHSCKHTRSSTATLTDLVAHEVDDDSNSMREPIPEEQPLPYGTNTTSLENPRTRQIEPQQTWIARLFHVKPATKYICLSVTNRRARQEIANLLRDWRKYGARDIVVDKDRNMVFGRVGAKNCEYIHSYLLVTD